LGLAESLVGPGNEAEEVVHDVFVEVWRAADAYRAKPGTVRAWLIERIRVRARLMWQEAPEIADQFRPSAAAQRPGGGWPDACAPVLLRESIRHALGEISRFSVHADALGCLLEADRQQVESLLFALDTRGRWDPCQRTQMQIWPLLGHGDACLVRLAQGSLCCPQRLGITRLFVLQGRCEDGRGRIYGPGRSLQVGSAACAVLPGVELIGLLRRAGGDPHGIAQGYRHQAAPHGPPPAEGLSKTQPA
jgi:hypothetical protein